MTALTILGFLGISNEEWASFLHAGITLLIAAGVAVLAYIIAKKFLARLVHKIAGKTPHKWDDLLFDQKFFNRLGFLLIPIVVRIGINSLTGKLFEVIDAVMDIWVVLASILLISAALDGVNRIYESYPISKNRPIKVFIQLIVVFLYCAGTLVVISIFTEESIGTMLTGLAAFAAIILLIFRDSILGFVAGIQLAANNMLHIGDWITMPASGADGDVLEINLTTVKVQNWDKTITTIPTYKLVSESFTNWRGMFESAGRRIKRSINIDVNSIHYLTPEEIEQLKQSSLLRDYIERKVEELRVYNASLENPLDSRRLTNIGTFREYLEVWLSHNADINLNMIHVVRQLQPTPTGVPLEIYCFSARQRWVEYERVQADIFDHVFAVMELFNLRMFQYSGQVAREEAVSSNTFSTGVVKGYDNGL